LRFPDFDASVQEPWTQFRAKEMANAMERRASRRFSMSLPLTVRSEASAGIVEHTAQTRDISFRGLYFLTDTPYEAGSKIEFVLTLPKEITQAGDVRIRCYGRIVRVEARERSQGVAACIERYDFLPASP
jgi:PilZ domain